MYQQKIIFIFLLLSILVFNSCDSIDITSNEITPAEFINIYLEFFDAETNSKRRPENITVSVYDKNRLLLTEDNEKINQINTITLTDSILHLKLPSGLFNKESDQIYSFTINTYAEKYIKGIKTIHVFQERDIYQPVFMVHEKKGNQVGNDTLYINTPLNGISLINRRVPYATNVLPKFEPIMSNTEKIISPPIFPLPIPITIPPFIFPTGPNNKNNLFEASVIYPESIQFEDKLGESLIGLSANFTLNVFDNRFDTPLNAFPSSYLVTDVIDKNKKVIASPENPKFLRIYGYIDVRVDIEGEEAKKQEAKNLSIEAPISMTFKRFDFEDFSKETVGIWTLVDSTGQWRQENIDSVITSSANDISFHFTTNHLTFFAVGKLDSACVTPLDIPLITDIGNPTRTRYFRIKYGNSSLNTGGINSGRGAMYGYFVGLNSNNPKSLTVKNPLRPLVFEILKTPRPTDVVFHNPIIQLNECDSKIENISLPSQMGSDCERLEFKFICTGRQSCNYSPSVPIQLEIDVAGQFPFDFTPVGSLDNDGAIGIDITGLAEGTALNFRLKFGTNQSATFRLLIDEATSSSTFHSPFIPNTTNINQLPITVENIIGRQSNPHNDCSFASTIIINLSGNNCNLVCDATN